MGGLMVLDVTPGYQTVVSNISSVLSENELVSVLGWAATTCVGLVLLWWSVRKVSGMLMRAFKKGKLRM